MSMIDQYNQCVYGEAVLTRGLGVRDAVNGYGLDSWGLIWQGPDIWLDTTAAYPLTTSWSNTETSITTTWTNTESVITTTWTECQNGLFGEFNS